jgi:hypothetical protein
MKSPVKANLESASRITAPAQVFTTVLSPKSSEIPTTLLFGPSSTLPPMNLPIREVSESALQTAQAQAQDQERNSLFNADAPVWEMAKTFPLPLDLTICEGAARQKAQDLANQYSAMKEDVTGAFRLLQWKQLRPI